MWWGIGNEDQQFTSGSYYVFHQSYITTQVEYLTKNRV